MTGRTRFPVGRRVLCALAAAASVWVVSVEVAVAQVTTGEPLGAHALSVEAEIAAGEATERAHGMVQAFPWVLGALDVRARLASLGEPRDRLALELDASLRVGWLERERTWSRTDSPPWMAIWLGAALSQRTSSVTLRGSIGLAPPIRSVVSPQVPDAQLAAGWGDWDRWLAIEKVVPFGFLGLVEGHLGAADLGADLALIAAPSFAGNDQLFDGYDLYRRPSGFFFWSGLGAWVRGHVGDALSLGIRLQGVLMVFDGTEVRGIGTVLVEEGTRTDFQLSAIPFVRLSFPPGYVELRWQVNLDEPHGPIFAGPAPVWALAMRGGVSLDP